MNVPRTSPMTNIPIIKEDCWTALEILADKTGSIKECAEQRAPWCPATEED
jgi:hypothetical protein